MLVFILFFILAASFAYLSSFNSMPVTVNFGWYVFHEIPLFYVILGSFVLGLVLSYFVLIYHEAFAYFVLRGKKKEIKQNRSDVLELTKRVHQLELENEKLKHGATILPDDINSL
ncbi:LapA family protein [Candidatus Woesebacteria bacterium]|nr:LapA family protein [Candidatus Woesebacteria bacterium]